LVHFLDILGTEDLLPIFKSIKIPVQVITGRQDYICPPDSLEFLKEMMPRACFNIMEDSGHFPFLIRSAEFNRVVEQFLSTQS